MKYKKYAKYAFVCVASLILMTPNFSFATPSKVSTEEKIHYLNTEEGGDAILLESNGQFALIDSGENSEKNINEINKYLSSVGATHLDFFIATHMHSDHIGNIADLIDSGIYVENIVALDTGITANTTDAQLSNNKNPLAGLVNPIEYKDVVVNGSKQSDWESDIYYRNMLRSFNNSLIKNKKTELKNINMSEFKGGEGYVIRPEENKVITLGDYILKFNNVYNGRLDYNFTNNVVSSLNDTNSTSAWITLTDKNNNKVCFSGDITSQTAEKLFKTNNHMWQNVSAYKISHHGANDSEALIDKLQRSNPDIIMFGMATNANYNPVQLIVNKNIPLYSTNHNDSHIVTKLTRNGVEVQKNMTKINANGEKTYITIKTANKDYKGKWVNKNNEWYYYIGNEYLKNKWIKVDGYWYYLNNEGKALKNGWHSVDNEWYYFAKLGGETSYYNKNYPGCSMFENTWIHYYDESNKIQWYYVNENGALDKNKWKSDVENGVKEWYYLDANGLMVRNEVAINNKKYYFAPTSHHKSYSGRIYKDGQMYESEWLKLKDGSWKYYKSSGEMANNESIRIGSKIYRFNNAGICLNP